MAVTVIMAYSRILEVHVTVLEKCLNSLAVHGCKKRNVRVTLNAPFCRGSHATYVIRRFSSTNSSPGLRLGLGPELGLGRVKERIRARVRGLV